MTRDKIAGLSLFVITVLVIAYVFSLRTQLQEQKALVVSYEEKVNALSGITRADAKKVNDMFIERFFNYQNTADRYKNIQEIMTNQGFRVTHPSGEEIPEKGANVITSTRNMQSYEHVQDRNHVEYINTFIQTVSYNDQSSSSPMMIKTKLIFIKGRGWKVDDFENIPMGSSQQIRVLGTIF